MLTRLEGVAGTKLRIARETRLEVATKAGVWVPPERMLRQIASGGFDVRQTGFGGDVRLILTGTLRERAGGFEVAVDQPGAADVVVALVAEPGRERKPKGAGAFALVDAGAHAGRRVEVEGLWRPGRAQSGGSAPDCLAVVALRESR